MIGTKRMYPPRETGEFIGSVNVENTILDGYMDDNKIILRNNKDIGSVMIILIKENPEAFMYTPWLELFNELKYRGEI